MDDQQRARELLALEYERDLLDPGVPTRRRDGSKPVRWDEDIAIRAITATWRAAPECPEGFVLVRKEAIDWLNGETEEGFECPPDRYFRGEPPRYWWRSVFREKAGLAASPQEASDD